MYRYVKESRLVYVCPFLDEHVKNTRLRHRFVMNIEITNPRAFDVFLMVVFRLHNHNNEPQRGGRCKWFDTHAHTGGKLKHGLHIDKGKFHKDNCNMSLAFSRPYRSVGYPRGSSICLLDNRVCFQIFHNHA